MRTLTSACTSSGKSIKIAPPAFYVLTNHRYCVDVSKQRYVDDADEDLFRAIDASNSEVPIVLVLTKKDAFMKTIIGGALPNLMLTRPDLAPYQMLKIVRDEADEALKSTANEFLEKFQGITKGKLIGPILTTKGMFHVFPKR